MNGMDRIEKISTERKFAKYVSQNILGMIGISAYVIADTFFISRAEGAGGITALNLVLPLYSLIYGIGADLISCGLERMRRQICIFQML